MASVEFSQTIVTEEPEHAPKDYKKKKPMDCESSGSQQTTCSGSGVPFKELTYFKDWMHVKDFSQCPNCKSQDIICIFEEFISDWVAKQDTFEFECKKCGKYFTHSFGD